eukprot:GHVU01122842.1.p2 GENE.GHVU01122842.1~~GHVU01122842.1.p2  ORF type:complete len:200 (+),score=19.93 GHVU01122842.1:172-771(+)
MKNTCFLYFLTFLPLAPPKKKGTPEYRPEHALTHLRRPQLEMDPANPQAAPTVCGAICVLCEFWGRHPTEVNILHHFTTGNYDRHLNDNVHSDFDLDHWKQWIKGTKIRYQDPDLKTRAFRALTDYYSLQHGLTGSPLLRENGSSSYNIPLPVHDLISGYYCPDDDARGTEIFVPKLDAEGVVQRCPEQSLSGNTHTRN